MKFWEAMRELEEGKRVTHLSFNDREYLYLDRDYGFIRDESDLRIDFEDVYAGDGWEIFKQPELYWQWRTPDLGRILNGGDLSIMGIHDCEKHAGPWIKTEDGFKKADNWEQF